MTTDRPTGDLLRAAARLNRWATRHTNIDIPFAQARLLALVEDLGPARVTTLAEQDNSSQPTMTAQVQRLIEQGWATRESDPVDGRATLVRLTAAGRAELDRLRLAREAALAPVVARLSTTEREAIPEAVAILEALLAAAAEEPTL